MPHPLVTGSVAKRPYGHKLKCPSPRAHIGGMKHTRAPTPAERARELLVTIQANAAHDALLREEQLQLEADGVRAEADPIAATQIEEAKSKWLNALAPQHIPALGNRLHQIQIDRAGIAAAELDLQRQLFAATADGYREWLTASAPRWVAISVRRCRALLDLRRANSEAEAFRAEAAAHSPGAVSLPHDRTSGVFGSPIVGDQIYGFLEACVKSGILDRKDIQDA